MMILEERSALREVIQLRRIMCAHKIGPHAVPNHDDNMLRFPGGKRVGGDTKCGRKEARNSKKLGIHRGQKMRRTTAVCQ